VLFEFLVNIDTCIIVSVEDSKENSKIIWNKENVKCENQIEIKLINNIK